MSTGESPRIRAEDEFAVETSPAKRSKARGSTAALDADNGAALFARIGNGDSITEIAKAFGVDRDAIYKWKARGGDERLMQWNAAMEESSHALVERAWKHLADPEATLSSAHAQIAKAKSEYWRWLSGRRSPAYADASPLVNVVNIGTLHMSALVAHGTMLPALPGPVVDADVEIVVEEGGEGEL